jgi:chromosome segregation ATPase
LLTTYANRRRIDRAIADACRRTEEEVPYLRGELIAVEAEIAKTERARQRYFAAFEAETLSGRTLAARVAELEQRLEELTARHDELREAVDDQRYEAPTEADLGDLRAAIEEAISEGTPAQRKALMRAQVASIKIDGREAIHPIFRLPAAPPVRLMSTWWTEADSNR